MKTLRPLAGRDELLQEARTIRDKKLLRHTMIYLGTCFCPSGRKYRRWP